MKPLHCAQLLKQNKVSGMIVISVEGEGDPSGFETISKATKEGVVLTTSEGADGIAKAFSEVAKLISGDVVLVRDVVLPTCCFKLCIVLLLLLLCFSRFSRKTSRSGVQRWLLRATVQCAINCIVSHLPHMLLKMAVGAATVPF
jgi:hypothetical protein